jgi:hypothetical protein
VQGVAGWGRNGQLAAAAAEGLSCFGFSIGGIDKALFKKQSRNVALFWFDI